LTAPGKTFLQRLPGSVTAISFTNWLSEEKALENSLLTSGAGVAAGDVDNDGWCDLYFCRLEGPNVLCRNLGNWKFEDVTATAGVACDGQFSSGAAFADIEGDGDLDLLVNSWGGGTRLFLNDGKGGFREATDCGLVRKYGSTSMALADMDGNGTLDLYVCNYATTKIEDRPNARFEAKTVEGKPVLIAIDGVPLTSPDLTNRYFVDASRTVRESGEPDFFYLNDGHGKFRPVSWVGGAFLDEAGKPLAFPTYDFGLSVMLRDIDGDRVPDIYVCNDLFPPDRIWINDGSPREITGSGLIGQETPSSISRGQVRFRALSNLAVRNTCRFTMGLDFADINRDGFDDIYAVDMLSREHALRKVQTVGVFPIFLPVGMIDNRVQYKRNTLFLNRGDGTYAEIAQLAGLEATEWSWMPAFLDVDLDGYEDLLVTTGHHRDSLNADAVGQILHLRRGRRLSDAEHRALKRQFYPVLTRSAQAFRNRGDLTFEDKAREWGFDYLGISQGLCLADLDNDGDLDVVMNNLSDAPGVYRNESAAPRVAVRLKGRPPNTYGIGARIKLLGGPVPQSQEIICGGRYLSCDDTVRMFATGQATNGLSIEVIWRSGAVSRVQNVQPNRIYEIAEEHAPAVTQHATRNPQHGNPPAQPLFTDVSQLLEHTHVDDPFNDFEQQPLLPRRLSQLGPGVSWVDVDGDGWDDLIIGSGISGHLAVFQNDGKGAFRRRQGAPLDEVVVRDQTTILGWRRTNGQTVLLAGSSNYEDGSSKGSLAREYNLAKGVVQDNLPGWEISVGPLAMADVDGDGHLDLFAGGRVVPKEYPMPASSLLFRGTGAGFVIHEENCRRLGLVGLASGAVFSDLDGDGDPDLIVACEWGPLRIFRNEQGRLVAWDPAVEGKRENGKTGKRENDAVPLSSLKGWWNGVATGDFDGDGRLDIVASNWGRNSKYQSYRAKPLGIVFGEWRVPGVVDQMETYYDPGLKKLVPWCSYDVARALPWVAEGFPTYEAFGRAGVAEILGERSKTAKFVEANWLETTVFMNRGDHFEARLLPVEAQFAPAFGISVGDLDGDGHEDIFLSQNFFAVDGDTSRCDAGRGLLLAGDGKGSFRPVPGQESGVKVYGEQRGCALSDYDADGRVDLVVTQNGAETKLYRNVGARPGLRVRLIGPVANPWAVGASLRLQFGSRLGPVREIHAGSGYWSQDSVVPVLGTPERPTHVWVRWPGGKTTTTEVPAEAREIQVNPLGTVKRVR
jgi:hypothetical protein